MADKEGWLYKKKRTAKTKAFSWTKRLAFTFVHLQMYALPTPAVTHTIFFKGGLFCVVQH
jgi:hypothetical protein